MRAIHNNNNISKSNNNDHTDHNGDVYNRWWLQRIPETTTRNIMLPRRASGLLCTGSVLLLLLTATLTLTTTTTLATDSATLKPSVILILPQSLTVPTKATTPTTPTPEDQPQYIALINNVRNERDDQYLRQKYPTLSLQIRDASEAITGHLFFERTIDYFSPDQQHLLVPIDLREVSTAVNSEGRSFARQPQHLIVSVRHVGLDAGHASESHEIVSSMPVPVEKIASADGRRNFAIVQTDKPIYKPEDRVRIRSLVVNDAFRPVLKDEIKIQIKNPHKVVVEEIRFPNNQSSLSNTRAGQIFADHVFEFPPEPMLGTWSVLLLHSDPIANDTISFELKEYVLPTFEIQFETPKYILPSTEVVPITITAKYHYGKPVQGKASFKFGLREFPDAKIGFIRRSSIKDVNIQTGRVEYKVPMDIFKNYTTSNHERTWFPTLAGWSFVIEATVTEMSTGHREIAQDTSTTFLLMPYVFSFDDSIEYFLPDRKQQLSVQVIETHNREVAPAGARILAQFTDQSDNPLAAGTNFDAEAFTDDAGRATFNFGPLAKDITSVQATFRYINSTDADTIVTTDQTDSVELAVGEHTLRKHESINGWILMVNKTVTQLSVGDQFISRVLIEEASVIPHRKFYTIMSRGQILSMNPLDLGEYVNFKISEEMVPSIRVVVFALTSDSVGFISDSMRINIEHSLDCGLSLEYTSHKKDVKAQLNTHKPNDKGQLSVKARPGDFVSLIGVDAAVYTLNNRTRLDSIRMIQRVKKLDPGCGFGGGSNNLDVFHNAGLMFFKEVSDQQLASRIGSSCMPIARQLGNARDIQLGYSRPVFTAALGSPAGFGGHRGSRGSRGKRQADFDVEQLLAKYERPIDKLCCRLGTFDDSPQNRNCEAREKIVARYMDQDDDQCAHIFAECCRKITTPKLLTISLSDMVPIPTNSPEQKPVREVPVEARYRNGDFSSPGPINFGHLDRIESQTLVRNDFRETWLFDIVEVDQSTGMASLYVRLPHSITSWSVSALALNQQQPMCFMPRPLRLTTFQEIFLQVSMPYKIIQGEQIDLIATIFNYSPMKKEVLVYMYGVENMCSEAEPGERSDRKRVIVDKHSSISVIFPLYPLKPGKYPIKILAITASSDSSDIVEKKLNVVAKGRQITDETTFSLDPLNQQRRNKRSIRTGNLVDDIDSSRGVQKSSIRLTPSRDSDHIVPQTQECIVSAIGDRMGQVIQTTMLDVDNLIRLPLGCGEQVMIYLGPTLYTAKYLQSVNKLSGDIRWRAIRYIQKGYKTILGYRNDDGSFKGFVKAKPSVWLTAFVAKMLCQTERTPFISDEVHVDKTVINMALNWLVDRQDPKNGYWIEKNPVYHREMLGGVLRENALTSFVLVTLNECAHHATELTDNDEDKLKMSSLKAEEMLLASFQKSITEKNVYVMALTAYSLSVSHPKDAIRIMDALIPLAERSESRNQLHWRVEHYSIEVAAYALEAIIELAPYIVSQPTSSLKLRPAIDAAAIANWLASRRSYTGAFESTQDTMIALEALSRYAQIQANPGNHHPLATSNALIGSSPVLSCNVTVNNHMKRSIQFDQNNAQILQSFKLGSFDIDPTNGEILDVITSGNGVGTMSVKVKYNILYDEDQLCKFNIDVEIKEWRPKVQIQSDDLKMFDKSLLSELNLIDQGDLQRPQQQQRQVQPKPVRLRRTSQTEQSSSGWASNLVHNLKAKLPSWLQPGTSTTTTTTTTTATPIDESRANRREPYVNGPSAHLPRRTNTSRRSTTEVVLTSMTSPHRKEQHQYNDQAKSYNSLSEKLDVASNETSTNNSSTKVTTETFSQNSNRLVLLLQVCTNYVDSRLESEMAIIEVGILSGFKPYEADLKEIDNEPSNQVTKYELSPDHSMVVFYLDSVPSGKPFCLQFRLIRFAPVYNIQPGYVRVYEYYTPASSCSSHYSPTRWTDLIEPNCFGSSNETSQVCKCASKSLCPGTRKLLDLSEIQSVNVTRARDQLEDLVCSSRYDFVALVNLKNVKYIDVGKMYKLSLRVRYDLRGNLTKLMKAQRQQRVQAPTNIRKPGPAATVDGGDELAEDAGLNYLTAYIESNCVRNDLLLLHLGHTNQWKTGVQGGNEMILFGKLANLEKRFFESTPKTPRPKSNILDSHSKYQEQTDIFNDAQQQQYSLALQLDKDSIVHDLTYQHEFEQRKAINHLVQWLERAARLEEWTCANNQ